MDFSLLNEILLYSLMLDVDAATVLYHQIDSLDDLHGIAEHPLAGVWEQETNGNVGFAKPRTRVVIYITDEPLPNGRMMCKIGFPMERDEMHINTELPSIVITTATNDSSSLGTFIQYLKRPETGNTEYGALSERADLIRKYLYKNLKEA